MDVLRFTPSHGEYELLIRTDSIARSWSRFRDRINKTGGVDYASQYADYTSTDNGKLELFSFESNALDEADRDQGKANSWKNKLPVIFETNKYQISIKFPKVDGTPIVKHAKREVEDFFFFDRDSGGSKEGGKLTGDVDFLNEPGVFKLEFEYKLDGLLHKEVFTFEICSPKLDTKNDYKKIISDVYHEYNNIIFRYLTLSYQQFAKGKINNDVIWIQQFEEIIGTYIKGIKQVINKPHFKAVRYTEYQHADKIKRWSNQLSEQFKEDEVGKGKTYAWERKYYAHPETMLTIDTMENRFVKYTLEKISKRLQSVISRILRNDKGDLSESRKIQLNSYKADIIKLASNPFFKTVGKFEGIKQSSLVLQSRSGYAQVYKSWLKLKHGINLYNGFSNIGTLQIWEIYELWCFVKMKLLVMETMEINKANYAELVDEDQTSMLNPFETNHKEHIITIYYPEEKGRPDDYVTLHYQKTYNRRSDQYHTATTEQRPDIVLNIHKKDQTLTYLYDAKYRVLDDDFNEGENNINADYPVPDAINQMHRYRDAIFYGAPQKYESKEVIGGYILFPGRGEEIAVMRRYFYKSIFDVNIGAFPLLPDSQNPEKEGLLLKKHLQEILFAESKYQLIENSIPQRGLYYTKEDPRSQSTSNELVLLGCVKDEAQWNWIQKNSLYNIRMLARNSRRPGAIVNDVRFFMTHHFVLYHFTNGKKDDIEILSIYDIYDKSLAPLFYEDEDMRKTDYPRSDFFNRYLVFEINTEKESEIEYLNNDKLKQYIIDEQLKYEMENRGTPIVVPLSDLEK